MIVDAKIVGRKQLKIMVIGDTPSESKELDTIDPYFYAIVPKGRIGVLKRLLSEDFADFVPTRYKPIVLEGNKYVVSEKYEVYKVVTENPRQIPDLEARLRKLGIRVSGANMRYIVRNCFDLDVRFFNSVPLYYGLDPSLLDRLQRLKILIIDVEAVNGRPILASCLWYRPLGEIRKDDVISLKLPDEQHKLEKLLREATMIAGHNVKGFDLPVLRRAGILIDEEEKSVVDTSEILATYGQSLKVGSARSLLDVAVILAEDAGITEEEIEIKRRVKGRIDRLSWYELERYNVNDVVLTAKILNVIFPFVATLSALTQIPISEISRLPAGLIAEYFLHRYCELLGYVPEYRASGADLKGERVYAVDFHIIHRNVLQCDVKMMYPTFVLKNFVDPTLHVGDESFDRKSGLGLLYSAVARLYLVRSYTKKLKKSNKLYEPLDSGVKALINALAYGVQGMRGEHAIMGNPWCPSKIFYGTREAQFGAIDHLRRLGIKVIYSDTDSFFIELGGCGSERECLEKIEEIVSELNKYLSRYGLEVDIEAPPGKKGLPLWDVMIIHSRKSYILRSGDVIVIKGSPYRNLDRLYTPECISLAELLRLESKEERKKYVIEAIENASIEDLFIRTHQQLWRLLSLDLQRYKRLEDEKKRSYAKVLTPWAEKPVLYLKKAKISHIIMPHSVPIVAPLMDHGGTLRLEEFEPFTIVEILSLRVDDYLQPIRARYGVKQLLVWNDGFFSVELESLEYVIQAGTREIRLPAGYVGRFPERPIGLLKEVRAQMRVRRVEIDERILRECVKRLVMSKLRQYGIL